MTQYRKSDLSLPWTTPWTTLLMIRRSAR